MQPPALVGIHHVKFPVSDLARSRAWYERVFDLRPVLEFADEEDGVVRGIAYEIPGLPEVGVALRENPAAARGITGFDPVGTEIHLYSMERHGLDPTGRPRTGRPVDANARHGN